VNRERAFLGFLGSFYVLTFASTASPKTSEPATDQVGRILFEREYDNNEIDQLVTVRPDGSDTRVLLTAKGGGLSSPAYSANNRRIAYARYLRNGRFEIFTMDANGHRRRQLTHSREEDQLNGAPSFSPDGRRIAYDSNLGTGTTQSHLFLIRSRGGSSDQLTRGPGSDFSPSFSPDGNEIVFARGTPGYEEICILRVGGTVRSIARLPDSSYYADGVPSFSPDGRQIVFQGIESNEVMIVNADGTGMRALAQGDSPAFSPDGTQIAYSGGEGDRYGLYLMNRDGSNKKRILAPDPFAETSFESLSW
jgi:TolB protein